MPFTRQTDFTKKVTDLPDVPSPSYTATQIKEYIETPSDENKTFVDGLIDELEADTGASNVGAEDIDGNPSTVQSETNKANSGLKTHKTATTLDHPDKSVTEPKLGDSSVSRRTIQAGAVGTNEIDPSIMNQPTTAIGVQAKFDSIDSQLADIAKIKIFRTSYLFNFIKKCLNGSATWAAIGDSITFGSAATNNYGYAYLTRDKLVEKYGEGISMENRGHSGYKVSQIQPLLESEIIPFNYDLITVACGTNDWNYGTPLNKFESDYRLMLETLISKTDADIICIGLGWFDTWNGPSNFTRETDYNKIIQKLALEYGLGYVDMYSMMKNSGYAFAEITYAPDPVHPNDLGHSLWADELFTYMDFQGNLVDNSVEHFNINRFNYDVGTTYTGTWYVEGPYSTVLNSYYKRSSIIGNKVEIHFVGNNIKLYFVSDVNCGKIKITLDGEVVEESYDLYNPSFRLADISFKGLQNKEHVMTVEVLEKNPLSSANRVAFNVYDILSYGEASYVPKTLVMPGDLNCDYSPSPIDTNTNYYSGTLKSFNNLNSKFFIDAYGSKFKIFFTKGPDRGIITIKIDGEEVGTVDTYSASFVNKFMFETTEVPLGMHTIELVTTDKNASSTNYIQSVEGILCKTEELKVKSHGLGGTPITFQFYETPFFNVTPTFNGTAYVSSSSEKSVTVTTNPAGGTFDLIAEGY